MKMEREQEQGHQEREQDVHSSFPIQDNNLTLLPTCEDFASLNCNYSQLLLDSHPSFIQHSTHQLFDFFSHYSHLPTLPNSFHKLTPSSSSSSSPKRPRFDFPTPLQPQRDLARQRRQNISDKTRRLQKLMPCEKKMDTATTLEEAYKYVQFLQAQVRALSSMPLDSTFAFRNDLEGRRLGGFGGLGMLNRQQLLQVLVNSPVAQTMLYSKGFCIFSLEQLILMNKLTQANLFMQH